MKNNLKQSNNLNYQELNNFYNSMLDKLYHSIKSNDIPIDSTIPEAFLSELRRILASNYSLSPGDESSILNSLFNKVNLNNNGNQSIISRFQQLYSSLSKKTIFKGRWEILYIFNALSKKNSNVYTNFQICNDIQNSMLGMNDNNLNGLLSGSLDEPIISTEQVNLIQKNDYRDNINSVFFNNGNISTSTQILPIPYENQTIMKNKYEPRLVVNSLKTKLVITEKDIVEDLLFCLEGIDGKYIKYDYEEDGYILDRLIPWLEEIYNIVGKISVIGFLFKKVNNFLDYSKKIKRNSQYLDCFISSVQNEITDYYRLINIIKKQNNTLYENGERNIINLFSLFQLTRHIKDKMMYIAVYCDGMYTLRGCQVLNSVYSLYEVDIVRDSLIKIVNDCSRPFFSYILQWIKFGEINDPYKEFYVNILDGIKDDDIWNLKYEIVALNIPNFVKRDIIMKIFEVGKCLHFIRNYCKENYNLLNITKIIKMILKNYVNKKKDLLIENKTMTDEEINNILNDKENDEEVEKYKEFFANEFNEEKMNFQIKSYKSCLDFINDIFSVYENSEKIEHTFLKLIESNIDIIHKLINKDLVKIIFVKFKFFSNLESINKYLLLGQGDMMQALMESLYKELDKKADSITKHTLQGFLESAITNTNAKFNDKDCLQKLNIKLINPSADDVGWDVFCLEYKVEPPLSIIFSSSLLKEYQKIFLFFFKLKKYEYSQNEIWKEFKKYSRDRSKYDLVKNKLKVQMQFNYEIIHFIKNLRNFLIWEILETQYKAMLSSLVDLNTIDDAIRIHKSFIEKIKSECLLDVQNKEINKKLIELFKIIDSYNITWQAYQKKIDQEIFEENDINKEQNLKKFDSYLNNIYESLKKQLIELIHTIELYGKGNIKNLAVHLDYNSFYLLFEKEEEDKEIIKQQLRIQEENEKENRRREIRNNQGDIEEGNEEYINEENAGEEEMENNENDAEEMENNNMNSRTYELNSKNDNMNNNIKNIFYNPGGDNINNNSLSSQNSNAYNTPNNKQLPYGINNMHINNIDYSKNNSQGKNINNFGSSMNSNNVFGSSGRNQLAYGNINPSSNSQNINQNNDLDIEEDRIDTSVRPKVYGVYTKSRPKKE